ncbi:MAG: hypothetical protein AAGI70_03110, partial [Pseudomonadota bacterium]
LCQPHEKKYLEKIEELVKKQIDVVPVPGGVTASPETAEREESRQRGEEREKPERRSRGGRGRSRDGGRESRGAPVVGMGDHVPAFMLIEIRPKKAAPLPTEAETGDGEEAAA